MIELHRNGYTLSTNPARLDADAIFAYLSRSYWANQRSKETVEKSLQHSLSFGLYFGDQQVGLARVISDYATFAYLCDVYVLEEHRGEGLGKWLIETVTSQPDFANIRMFLLATFDAHGLYRQFDFDDLPNPERWMRRLRG